MYAEVLLSGTSVEFESTNRDSIDVPVFKHPIEIESDGTVNFSPQDMEDDRPYTFRFLEHPFTAIKRADGSIDVYYFP